MPMLQWRSSSTFRIPSLPTRRVVEVLLALAIGLVAITALRSMGNWYASHRAVRFVAVITGLGIAALVLPVGAWLARLSTRSIATITVAVPAFCFFSATNGSIYSGDTRPVMPTAVQMLRHGNRDLAAWQAEGRWEPYKVHGKAYFLTPSSTRSGLYSAYPAGMELFAFPSAAILVAGGASCTENEFTLCERITARLLTCAMLVMFFYLAAHFVTLRTATIATYLLMTGSAFTSTAPLGLWQQDGVTFWMLVVLLCEAKSGPRWLHAFACAAMLACRPSAVTFLVPFGCWLLAQDWRRGVGLTLRALACYCPWAMLYVTHYGTLFGPSMNFLRESWQIGAYLPGVLVSPSRGFLVYQPWCLLALLIPQPWLRWWSLVLAAIALQTLLVASWPMWWGGHCYGSRLMTELVPLAGLLILRPLETLLVRSWGGWVVAALFALGLAIHLTGGFGHGTAWNVVPKSVDNHLERLWDWRDPPFLYDWHL